MRQLSDIVERVRRRIETHANSFLRKKTYLKIIFEQDRLLSRLSHRRDRAFETLALEYMNVESSGVVHADFNTIVEEIKKVETERGRTDPTEASTLTTLVVPDLESSHSGELSTVSFMTRDERQALYRVRLRGLYIDLGELLFRHPTGEAFRSESDAVEEIQAQISSAQKDREEALEQLASTGKLSSVLILLGLMLIISVSIGLFLY